MNQLRCTMRLCTAIAMHKGITYPLNNYGQDHIEAFIMRFPKFSFITGFKGKIGFDRLSRRQLPHPAFTIQKNPASWFHSAAIKLFQSQKPALFAYCISRREIGNQKKSLYLLIPKLQRLSGNYLCLSLRGAFFATKQSPLFYQG